MLLGSFLNGRENRGLTTRYAPEDEIDFQRKHESHVFGSGANFEVRKANSGDERKPIVAAAQRSRSEDGRHHRRLPARSNRSRL